MMKDLICCAPPSLILNIFIGHDNNHASSYMVPVSCRSWICLSSLYVYTNPFFFICNLYHGESLRWRQSSTQRSNLIAFCHIALWQHCLMKFILSHIFFDTNCMIVSDINLLSHSFFDNDWMSMSSIMMAWACSIIIRWACYLWIYYLIFFNYNWMIMLMWINYPIFSILSLIVIGWSCLIWIYNYGKFVKCISPAL